MPQKQPPASTAVCMPCPRGTSIAARGIGTAFSAASAPVTSGTPISAVPITAAVKRKADFIMASPDPDSVKLRRSLHDGCGSAYQREDGARRLDRLQCDHRHGAQREAA